MWEESLNLRMCCSRRKLIRCKDSQCVSLDLGGIGVMKKEVINKAIAATVIYGYAETTAYSKACLLTGGPQAST